MAKTSPKPFFEQVTPLTAGPWTSDKAPTVTAFAQRMGLEPWTIGIGRFGGIARAADDLPRSGQFTRAKVVNYWSLFVDFLLQPFTLVV
jgi:hypothetical protein